MSPVSGAVARSSTRPAAEEDTSRWHERATADRAVTLSVAAEAGATSSECPKKRARDEAHASVHE